MRPWILLVSAALVAGCATPLNPAPDASEWGPAFEPVDANVAAKHPAAQRTESEVAVAFGVTPFPGYTATKTIEVGNTLAGFAGAYASYATPGGGLTIESGERGGYEAIATLRATAATEAEARQLLATLHVDSEDQVKDGRLHLKVHGRMDDRSTVNAQRSITLHVRLDPAVLYSLDGDSNGGGLSAKGLSGPRASLESSGGGLSVDRFRFSDLEASSSGGGLSVDDATADTLRIDSSGGGLSVEATARNADLQSSGGGLSADLRPSATGRFDVDSSGGGLRVTLARGTGIAYDATLDSSGGGARLSISGAETEKDGSVLHARSPGFDAARIQVMVNAESGGGGADVHD